MILAAITAIVGMGAYIAGYRVTGPHLAAVAPGRPKVVGIDVQTVQEIQKGKPVVVRRVVTQHLRPPQ